MPTPRSQSAAQAVPGHVTVRWGISGGQRAHVAGAFFFFFFQAEDGIRDIGVTGVQTCALPICSRAVKPPVIFGDVWRPKPMTVSWSSYAQSLTSHPMKGMLTGPVTMLQWSFVRDDQPRALTCRQIALAIRDEVEDLEKAGVKIIQIDEPAIREGLPLRREDWVDISTGRWRGFPWQLLA